MILHAIQDNLNQYLYASGSWKAVEANRLSLKCSGLSSKEVLFDKNNPMTVMEKVTPDINHVLIEYSKWPDLVIQLKRKHPHIGVHIRTHNAEAYQYFNRNKAQNYFKWSMWRKYIGILRRDSRCRQAADTLMGINEWDDANYWKWLPGKAAIRYLPYYSPWPQLRSEVQPQPWSLREPVILSMPGDKDPSGRAMMANFRTLSMKVSRNSGNRWSFIMTWWAQWHENVPEVGEYIQLQRDCPEPWDLLCRVRAVAVITPFGYGFKTTILDGLAAGCHVIVHPKLAKRLPLQVRQLCLICDPSRDEDILKLTDSLSTPPGNHNINQQLSEMAIDILRTTFK